jgi:RNA polymerase sigma-70 factor (ECF subfamily)
MERVDLDTDELLHRAAEADPQAVQDLLARHRDRLRRMVCVRMDPRLSPRIDPSDVVQEALAEAARKLPAFLERRDCAFYPWLRRIAWERLVQLHRRHIDAQRRSVTREASPCMGLSDHSAALLGEQLAASGTGPGTRLVRQELRERLRSAMEQLPAQDREVVVLRHLEQLAFPEIADVLGVTYAAAQSRYRRATERLHGLLSDGSEDLR